MKYFKTLTILLTALSTQTVSAQEPTDDMLASTQRVVFVDSVVVNKKDFLNAYLLNPDVTCTVSWLSSTGPDAASASPSISRI